MMKSKRWHALLSALALSLGFTAASSIADDRHEEAEDRFERLDTDGDDQLSRQEFIQHRQARLQARFDQLDENADGLIHIDEIPAHWRMRMERTSQRLTQLRGDGIDMEAFARFSEPGMDKRITRIDKNDGRLDRSELRAKRGGKRCGYKRSKRGEPGT